jgi:hypothetical protein
MKTIKNKGDNTEPTINYLLSMSRRTTYSDEDSIALLELTKPRKIMPPKSNANKDESTSISRNTPDNDTFDVILPPLLGSGNAREGTVKIEVNPEDTAFLDYEGISGAIGR